MKRQIKTGYGVFLIVLLIVPLLAACGGDDSTEESVLPTRVVVGDATAEVTADVVAEVSTPMPDATEEVTPLESLPPQAATDESTEATPEIGAPPLDTTPVIDQQGQATLDPNAPPGPPIDTTSSPLNVGPPGANVNAITDFSTLSIGDSELVSGILSIVDGTDAQVAVLTGEDGSLLEVDTPLAMTEPMVDQQVDMFGEIVAASGGTDAEFAIVPTAITAAGGLGLDAPTNNTDGSVPPVADDNAPPFPGAVLGEEVLDIELDSDLTALQAYDALVESLGDALDRVYWFSATGSEGSGWTFEFIDDEAQTLTRYTVNNDGQVTRSEPVPSVPLAEDESLALDREQIVVDSDVVTAQLEDTSNTPFGAPLITLAVSAEGGIDWIIVGPEPIIIDATQPLDN